MTRTAALALLGAAGFAVPSAAAAQAALDHVDPTKVEQTLPREQRQVATLSQAIAPAAAPAAVAADTPITVGAISLAGLIALRPSDFADIFETYVGRTLSPAALAGLADAISERARARGYLFATTTIPPQAVTAGLLRLVIDEGRIDEVRLVGTDNAAARRALAPLVGSGPVTSDQLQRRLLIAGDVDGLWLKRASLVREGPRNVLVVEIGTKRVSGVVDLDNSGTRPIGPLRMDATVRIGQLLAADDAVTFTAATNPLMPSELGYGRVRYVKRVSADGTEISASASYATVKPGSYLADRDIVGRSWTAQIGIARPLIRRRASSWWLQGSFDVRSVKQDWAGEPARRDRISSLRLGIYGYTTMFGGVVQASATVSGGIELFDATRPDDPLASRPDADGRYLSELVTASWTGKVAGRLSAQFTVVGQIADRPLLIAEQFGLGGAPYLRPYDYSERSGDEGAMGSAELRYALAKQWGSLREPLVYVFASGGYAAGLHDNYTGGSLFAAGGGVRSGVGSGITADAGVAFPLSGQRYDTGNDNPVLNMRISKRF